MLALRPAFVHPLVEPFFANNYTSSHRKVSERRDSTNLAFNQFCGMRFRAAEPPCYLMQRQDLLLPSSAISTSLLQTRSMRKCKIRNAQQKKHFRKITGIVRRDFRGALHTGCGNRNNPRDFRGAREASASGLWGRLGGTLGASSILYSCMPSRRNQ